eukprot:913711-Alexandrium_andersonii.AAC.1
MSKEWFAVSNVLPKLVLAIPSYSSPVVRCRARDCPGPGYDGQISTRVIQVESGPGQSVGLNRTGSSPARPGPSDCSPGSLGRRNGGATD